MRRDHTKIIWRTVVFAGAMLGTPGCKHKQAPTTPANEASTMAKPDATTTTPTTQTATPDPSNPCSGDRPRGSDDEGATGRGFVLS